ncbi:MAG: hypothetical protein RR365_11305 [Bacteroides sp.]
MLADFVDKLTELNETKQFEINGQIFSDKPLHYVEPHVNSPREISVNSIDSICKLIKTEKDFIDSTFLVKINSARKISVFTTLLGDYSRYFLYCAVADVPEVSRRYMDKEQAIIELRSLYIPNEGTAYLLGLISSMSKDSSVKSEDNGVTQKVTAQQGISLLQNIDIRPRVSLQPFRTFLEVAQPESEFLLRIDEDGDIGLFEADGGVWELEAKRNIANYLEKELAVLIETGEVVVML